jgi:hypothetical protein
MAWSAEKEGPVQAVSAPLPFLASLGSGCANASAEAQPALPELGFPSIAVADVCTGCSVHNCYYLTVGTRCLVNGRRGLCTANPHICPEIKEVTCTCEEL